MIQCADGSSKDLGGSGWGEIHVLQDPGKRDHGPLMQNIDEYFDEPCEERLSESRYETADLIAIRDVLVKMRSESGATSEHICF